MIRVLGMFGLGGGFLLISSHLRVTAVTGLASMTAEIQRYSPFSYVGLALAMLVGMAFMLHSTPRPR